MGTLNPRMRQLQRALPAMYLAAKLRVVSVPSAVAPQGVLSSLPSRDT